LFQVGGREGLEIEQLIHGELAKLVAVGHSRLPLDVRLLVANLGAVFLLLRNLIAATSFLLDLGRLLAPGASASGVLGHPGFGRRAGGGRWGTCLLGRRRGRGAVDAELTLDLAESDLPSWTL
jgi:hypothetical protein